jgi:beta-hydroxylase
MFFNAEEFPFVAQLEARWQAIRREFEGLTPRQLIPWPEREIYRESWEVFALWGVGTRFDKNCRLCPAAAAAVEAVPGLTTASFARLGPKARILPHVGFTNTVLRCHMGLVVPEGCAIQVGSETRAWQEGQCLIFDDTVLHSAWNDSDQARVILSLDFVRPGMTFDATISQQAAELVQVLLQDDRSGGGVQHDEF